uniref:Uncharacterized protein n=1 Tax=Clastoptera arizonana TaxID=38151 RepID=A0A1B6BZW8_9HEMI
MPKVILYTFVVFSVTSGYCDVTNDIINNSNQTDVPIASDEVTYVSNGDIIYISNKTEQPLYFGNQTLGNSTNAEKVLLYNETNQCIENCTSFIQFFTDNETRICNFSENVSLINLTVFINEFLNENNLTASKNYSIQYSDVINIFIKNNLTTFINDSNIQIHDLFDFLERNNIIVCNNMSNLDYIDKLNTVNGTDDFFKFTTLEFEQESLNTSNTQYELDVSHVINKRESDVSLQKEIDEFDEEAINNQTQMQMQMELESGLSDNVTIANLNSTEPDNSTTEQEEETTTEEGPTIYPYTDKDGLIDVVADNGIKYISSESDNFPRSGEDSGNLAGITDDSEPLHYVISGESDLSQDSRKEVGIEDLLPDYVKPTVSGESENIDNGAVETATSSEEIVLSESSEEPPTTTTEAFKWIQNSREYRGENWESEEVINTKISNETKKGGNDELKNNDYSDENENFKINKSVNREENVYSKPIDVTNILKTSSSSNPQPIFSEEDNINMTSSEIASGSSEYDPWGNEQSSDTKSVIGNSIDLSEIRRKGEQVEMVEMSFDSSSDNSTNFSLESEHIANENFTIKNIELGSSSSESEEGDGGNDNEDYDVDKTEVLNQLQQNSTENTKLNTTNQSSLLPTNKILPSEIGNVINKELNSNTSSYFNITSQPPISEKITSMLKEKQSNIDEDISTTTPTNIISKPTNVSKIVDNALDQNSTSYLKIRKKRGIFTDLLDKLKLNGIENTTPYQWPQNSRENHGEKYESNSNEAKSENFDYFHASGHYSDYDDYSQKDVSVHVIESNSSDGVKIFVTKKNGSADLQKDYHDFKNEFHYEATTELGKSSENFHRSRRNVEEKLLQKYLQIEKESAPIKKIDDSPISKSELKELLRKLFLSKLKKIVPMKQYATGTKDKFIFKGNDVEEIVSSKPYKVRKAYEEFMKNKLERESKGMPVKIKTEIKNGIYIWNKTLNRLEKIAR